MYMYGYVYQFCLEILVGAYLVLHKSIPNSFKQLLISNLWVAVPCS